MHAFAVVNVFAALFRSKDRLRPVSGHHVNPRDLRHCRTVKFCRLVEALPPTLAISEKGVHAAHQLTQGDGNAVRRNLHFLLPYDRELDDMDAVGGRYSRVSLYNK
jgi:hypothetical protein